MDDQRSLEVRPTPELLILPDGMLKLTHIIYALHALSVLIGITTSVTIVGSFVSGVPSIIAVILNYLNRSKVQGTWLDSHFSWQIRTFWFALLWTLMIGFLILTIIGIPFALIGLLVVGVWVIYRVARGWLALKEGKTLVV